MIVRSTRPRIAGISSSIAELIAEYSPPIPAPVKNRKSAKLQKSHEKPCRRRDQVDAERDVNSFLRAEPVGQIAEEQRAEDRTDEVGRATQADLALGEVERIPSFRTPPIEPTRVTSRPSMIQVIPSAMTTSQCQRLQGNRSSRAGTSVSMTGRAASCSRPAQALDAVHGSLAMSCAERPARIGSP